MRILHWDEMFHPTFGYQINVLPKYQVKEGHEVVIVTSEEIERHPAFASFAQQVNIKIEDEKFSKKYGIQIVRLPIYKVISGRVIYKKGFLEKIKELEPDIIMCHTNDTLSSIIIAKSYKYLNTPIVFDNHMLDMASRNPLSKIFRWYFKTFITPLIVKNNWKVIRTQDDNYVNSRLGIPEKQTPFISFGSDTSIYNVNIENRKKIRDKYNIQEDDFVIIYTGKLSEVKGGKLLAETFKEKFLTDKNIVLVVIGNTIEDYEKEVEKIFKSSKNRVLLFPTQRYSELPQFYQMADLSIFPKQCSLSFYDAQACGLPVIAEDNNINIDRLSHNNGFVFRKDSIASFRETIEKAINLNDSDYKEISTNSLNFIKKNYDYEFIAKKYNAILEEEYKRFHRGGI